MDYIQKRKPLTLAAFAGSLWRYIFKTAGVTENGKKKSIIVQILTAAHRIVPDWYGISGADADTDIREKENSGSWYFHWYSIYILKEILKYVWQRYEMEAGLLRNFIPNNVALNSKHFTN